MGADLLMKLSNRYPTAGPPVNSEGLTAENSFSRTCASEKTSGQIQRAADLII